MINYTFYIFSTIVSMLVSAGLSFAITRNYYIGRYVDKSTVMKNAALINTGKQINNDENKMGEIVNKATEKFPEYYTSDEEPENVKLNGIWPTGK